MIDYEAMLLRLYTDDEAMRKLFHFGLNDAVVESLSDEALKAWQTAKGYFQRTGGHAIPPEVLMEDHAQYLKRKEDTGIEDNDSPIDVSWLVKKLQGEYLRSNFKRRIVEANSDKTFDPNLEPEEALDKAKELTRDLMKITVNSTADKPLAPMSEDMPRFIEDTLTWEDRVASGDAQYPVTFGFPEIDDSYQGIKPGELVTITAFLKIGKSYLLCKQALEAARQGRKVALFTLENSEEETYARLVALAGRLPMTHVSDKTLHGGERDILRSLVGDETFERIYVKQPKNANARTMEEMYWKAYDVGAELFIGDQFSHVYYPQGKRNDADWLVMDLKTQLARDLSIETGMASIWAAQLNRGAAKKKDPGADDIARGLGIAQSSDWVFYLSKPDRGLDIRNLSCSTARRGPAKKWELAFNYGPMDILVTREIAV